MPCEIEPDDLPSFWDKPQPPAVLKHGVLRRYLPVFTDKTGYGAPGHRVLYVDGYAGAGRYRDGTPGSPLVALQVARQKAPHRRLECVFIEQAAKVHRHLSHLVDPERALHGDVQKHLPRVLELVADAPLFLFLDPFGLAPPMDVIISEVLHRPASMQPRRRATEVVLNFASHTVRREGGFLASTASMGAGILVAMDRFMDGTWWRDLWDCEEPEADRAIVEGWCQRVQSKSGYRSWPFPVPRVWDGEPYYYLVLITQHEQGCWYFANAFPNALRDFYEATNPQQLSLFDPDHHQAQAINMIAGNIRQLVTQHGRLRVGDHLLEVFGDALGRGGGPQVRAAIKLLHRQGEVDHDGVGEHIYDFIIGPGPTPTLL